MLVRGKKVLRLYLTDWQMRMVKDHLGVDCHVWEVDLNNSPNTKYGIIEPEDPTLKKMYLTEWQKQEMMSETGSVCNFIELKKGIIVRYGMLNE